MGIPPSFSSRDTNPWMKRLTGPYRRREERSDVAIQSPSFKQQDWIASSAKASSQ